MCYSNNYHAMTGQNYNIFTALPKNWYEISQIMHKRIRFVQKNQTSICVFGQLTRNSLSRARVKAV